MTARERYRMLEAEVEATYRVRWIDGYRGAAWARSRRLEAPRPRGPMSAAIVLHEVGHIELGHGPGGSAPRCQREYEAWAYAVREMERRGIDVTARVRERIDGALRYALHKALRRGLREIPAPLRPWGPNRGGPMDEGPRFRFLTGGPL